MKLIAAVAIAIAAPQTSYTQHTRPQDVNVVNTPNVNALQGGAWSVGINPSSNTVLVASSSREPVFTTPDASAGQHFPEVPIEIVLSGGVRSCYASFRVYARQVLVIEQVSGISPYGRRISVSLGLRQNDREQQSPCDQPVFWFVAHCNACRATPQAPFFWTVALRKIFAHSWWVPSRISALGGRTTFIRR